MRRYGTGQFLCEMRVSRSGILVVRGETNALFESKDSLLKNTKRYPPPYEYRYIIPKAHIIQIKHDRFSVIVVSFELRFIYGCDQMNEFIINLDENTRNSTEEHVCSYSKIT